MNWYNELNKSPLNPPSYLFGIVWPILYLSMFISFCIVFFKNYDKKTTLFYYSMSVFSFQLITNFLWSFIFFRRRNLPGSLVIILLNLLSIVVTIYVFYKLNPIASYILIPLLCWVAFATYLNSYIVFNN